MSLFLVDDHTAALSFLPVFSQIATSIRSGPADHTVGWVRVEENRRWMLGKRSTEGVRGPDGDEQEEQIPTLELQDLLSGPQFTYWYCGLICYHHHTHSSLWGMEEGISS